MSSSRIGRFAIAGLVVASTAGLAACNPTTPPPPPPPTTTTTAPPPASTPCASSSPAIVCSQLTVDGLNRKFYTHVSAQPAPASGRPVLFYFHGDGGTGNYNFASIYAQTDPDGAVVIQMDGPNNVVPSLGRGTTAWSFYQDGTGPDDVNFTRKVLDGVIDGSLVPGANVDARRVYAAGSSRGGFMVDTLTVDVRTAARFAAVVSLSGNFYCEDGDTICQARVDNGGLATSAAVMHIHGNSDLAVAPPGKIPTPYTGTITWPWPLGSMSYGHGCSGNYAYSATLAPMGGKTTYEYKPAGGCSTDYRLVLLVNGGHGVAGWESYGWTYLKAKTTA